MNQTFEFERRIEILPKPSEPQNPPLIQRDVTRKLDIAQGSRNYGSTVVKSDSHGVVVTMDDLMALADEAGCDEALPQRPPDSKQSIQSDNGNDLLDAIADEAAENCVEGSPRKTAHSLQFDDDPRCTAARSREPLSDMTNSRESIIRRTKTDEEGDNRAGSERNVRKAVVATVDAFRNSSEFEGSAVL